MLDKSVQVNYDLEGILQSASEYKGTVVKNTQFPNHMYSCHVVLYRCSLTDSDSIRKWSSIIRCSDKCYVTAYNENTGSEHSHFTDAEAVISRSNESFPSNLRQAGLSEQHNNPNVFEPIVENGSVGQAYVENGSVGQAYVENGSVGHAYIENGSVGQAYVAKLEKCSELTCTYCQVIFSSSTELKLHFEVHNGQIPLACADCGEIFVSFENLSLHRDSFSIPALLKCAINKVLTIQYEFI